MALSRRHVTPQTPQTQIREIAPLERITSALYLEANVEDVKLSACSNKWSVTQLAEQAGNGSLIRLLHS